MSQGFAASSTPLVTQLDAAEATHLLEPRRALLEVDSRELSPPTTRCWPPTWCRDVRTYECQRLLARSPAALKTHSGNDENPSCCGLRRTQ